MSKRVLFGALAALGAASVALDAIFSSGKYPVLHKVFDGDWDVAHNLIYAVSSFMAAVFGYLAVNYKEPGNGKEAK